eukprot:gnl/TRDRNA2_/TRDRNA2_43620_c0_seq1.p1 gnl/TRDRNA2_/TRDRNA2_43620_c0~~gnl/TRDRNA2_/TRDRNA2_43620_c0_seq1.p1  ORF type:complete len:490 (-),score=142.27 gnl/TRDRNA2_/TRDRNA2_43620_c0_seq1:131-1600(-)
MPHGKRRFAKNKEDVHHFRLIHRSQADAHAGDPGATPLVLEPCLKTTNGLSRRGGADPLQIPESLQVLGPEIFGLAGGGRKSSDADRGDDDLDSDEEERIAERLDELDDDCYFPKDGYDYSKHLLSCKPAQDGNDPGALKGEVKVQQDRIAATLKVQGATNDDEREAMLALEHADDYEEDDGDDVFDQLLPSGVVEPDAMLWGPKGKDDVCLADIAALKEMHAAALMSMGFGELDLDDEDLAGLKFAPPPRGDGSSRAARAANAAELEQLLEEEYGDDELGACEEQEIEGTLDIENCDDILEEYLENKQTEVAYLKSVNEPQGGKMDSVPRCIEETKALAQKYYLGEQDEEETDSGSETRDTEDRTWDCESVLSTLSNLSNRPGKIGRIKVLKKPGSLPAPIKEGKEDDEEEEEEDDIVELPEVNTTRAKGETAEEKKARKASVKEMRRVCRKMKKESKEVYKNEASKLSSRAKGNGDVRQNQHYVKIA